jgi:hypothetical protein
MNGRQPSEPPWDPVVGGVLVRLSRDPESRRQAMETLAAHPAVTLGEVTGRWATLAVEASHASEALDLHAWLSTVVGIEWVEVVAVHFDDPRQAEVSPTETEVMA